MKIPKIEVMAKQLQSAGLKRFESSLAWASQVTPSRLSDIHKRATQSTIKAIRMALAQNYTASGLGRETGDLYDASVKFANVISAGIVNSDGTFTIGGLYIRMGRGFNKHVYASAGAFRYGGVRGAVGAKKQKKATRKSAERLSSRGVDTAAGVTYIKPRPPFFELLPDQVQRVADAYQTSFVKQVDAMFRSRQ